MIKAILGPFAPYLLAAMLGLLVLTNGATAWFSYSWTHAAVTASWEAKYEAREVAIADARAAEIERQNAAGNAAKVFERQRIAQIEAERDALQEQVDRLADEAAQDPDRDRIGLSPESVGRIGSIR
jgi:uncharacterized membrane protein